MSSELEKVEKETSWGHVTPPFFGYRQFSRLSMCEHGNVNREMYCKTCLFALQLDCGIMYCNRVLPVLYLTHLDRHHNC